MVARKYRRVREYDAKKDKQVSRSIMQQTAKYLLVIKK